jgi:hypothetical protein
MSRSNADAYAYVWIGIVLSVLFVMIGICDIAHNVTHTQRCPHCEKLMSEEVEDAD